MSFFASRFCHLVAELLYQTCSDTAAFLLTRDDIVPHLSHVAVFCLVLTAHHLSTVVPSLRSGPAARNSTKLRHASVH
jgi:hypothetical protein